MLMKNTKRKSLFNVKKQVNSPYNNVIKLITNCINFIKIKSCNYYLVI